MAVLDHLVAANVGVISTQVLAEFFVTITRKLAAPLSIEDGYQRLTTYWQTWTVVDVTGLIILEAARGVRDYQFSFWDGQIWAAAHLNQIPVVFSEDFSPGSVIEGVRFVNPFAEAFRVEAWV